MVAIDSSLGCSTGPRQAESSGWLQVVVAESLVASSRPLLPSSYHCKPTYARTVAPAIQQEVGIDHRSHDNQPPIIPCRCGHALALLPLHRTSVPHACVPTKKTLHGNGPPATGASVDR
ncbi:unnamed protein product [Ectocarpus sp. 8 AP-2014]